MNEEWLYLVRRYTEAGARSKFEDICAALFKKKHPTEIVKTVRVTVGDGGIDVFIGEISTSIQVIQCKFFINGIEDSQKEQIRDSFKTAIKSKEYKLSKWILCVPIQLSLREHLWWSYWKKKQLKEYQLSEDQLLLIDGADLLDDLKRLNLYNEAFDEHLKKTVEELHQIVVNGKFDLTNELILASDRLANLKNHFSQNKATHIHRKQTDEILTWVNSSLTGDGDSENILILKGRKGVGKSTILKDVYSDLLKNGKHLVLALKCDQIYNENLPDLVKQIFTDISSFSQLTKAVDETGRKFIVILDQLDALSQTLSSERKFLLTYINLITRLKSYSNVRLIVSTREFDLEYDADIRSLDQGNKLKHIKVSNLSDDEVKGVLQILKIETHSKVLIDLLRNPYNLELFTKIPNYQVLLKKETLISLSKLYSELWSQVFNRKEFRLAECLDTIARRMYDMHPNLVERRFLEDFKLEIEYLISHSILIENKDKLSFFHQSFYEYYLARWFVKSEKDPVNYIFEEDQNLYIRSLLKNLIEYLREENHSNYIRLYSAILRNNSIRFHIKYLLIAELGSISIPSSREKKLLIEILSGEYRTLFLETFNSSGWISFIIENDLLQLQEKELYSILYRNVNHEPELALDYIEKGDLETKDNLISNLIPHINEWNSTLIKYFEKYFPYTENNELWYFETLKKIAPVNIKFVLDKLEYILLNKRPKKERLKFDYRFDRIIDSLYESHQEQIVDLLLSIQLRVLSETSYSYHSERTTFRSSLLNSYLYDSGLYYKDSEDEKSIDYYLIKYYSKCDRTELLRLFERYKSTDHVVLLTLITKLLRDRSEEFVDEIVELASIINAKKGLAGMDDFFSLNVRRMIRKSILYYDKLQYNIVKNIILGISHPYEIWKESFEGRRKYHLNIGRKRFLFIKALPLEILENDKGLLRLSQEMHRRFGDMDWNKAIDRDGSRFGGVGPPLSNAKYEKFNDQSWINSMRIIDEKYRSDDFFKGGLLEHARVFEEIVSKYPDRFYPLIDKLFHEEGVSWKYISHGISGLVKAKYNGTKTLTLVKKEIKLPLDKEYTTYAGWHIGFLIDREAIDDEIVCFLVSIAKSEEYLDDVLNPDNPIMDFINTPRGVAFNKLMRLTEFAQYQDAIFSTIEFVLDHPKLLSNTIACGIIAELAHLNRVDIERAFNIFRSLASIGNLLILKHSLNTAQYFNMKFHNEMEFYFKEILKHEELYENAYFFVSSWIFPQINDYEMYNNFMERGEFAVKCALDVVESFLMQDDQVNNRVMQVLERCLECSDIDIWGDLAGLILRKFKPEYFDLLYPFMEKYVRTQHFMQDPRYFLEYLTSCTAIHPIECLNLIKSMEIPVEVDIRKKGYRGDEPLTLILTIYSRLRNESLKYIKEQSIALDIFDVMLQIPSIRNKAVEAMENVLN